MTVPEYELEFDRQTKLLYSLIVAGKSANFADAAMKEFMYRLALKTGNLEKGKIAMLPFDMLQDLSPKYLTDTSMGYVEELLRAAKTGNYRKLTKAIQQIVQITLIGRIVWDSLTPVDLEKIHGFGPKTSRFFLVWIDPTREYAVLDVHILRWLRACGHEVPRATPQNKKRYAQIEQTFINIAKQMGKTPRQLDVEIWEAGAGRTQEKAI